MLSCVTISMIRRPGMMLGWTLWLNLCLCAGFLQAVPDTPLVAEGTTVEIAGSRAWQWGIGAADDALGAGFSALAARLYRQALVEPSLEPGRRAAIQLSLVSALIGDAKYSDIRILRKAPIFYYGPLPATRTAISMRPKRTLGQLM